MKNILLYDEENYLGPGYFIVNIDDKVIRKFFKIYIMDNVGFPGYGLRAFSIDRKDSPEKDFSSIEFDFDIKEDNSLYEIFREFSKNLGNNIYSMDVTKHGNNNISVINDKETIKLVISKDNYNGRQHPTKFVDIHFGDSFSCSNYNAIHSLYYQLSKTPSKNAKETDIKKLLLLK